LKRELANLAAARDGSYLAAPEQPIESVEKVHFGARKILEALYEQNTKNNSTSNGRHIKS
jgi:hypothetical protein